MKSYTVPEVCEQLRLSRTTLWRLARAGELPTVKLGGSVRVLESDLLAFVAARRTVRQPVAEAA
jgi:excisionase family DNA binding protein